jgi:tRNA A-37 threonylcarbamoyl transferase component Bud32
MNPSVLLDQPLLLKDGGTLTLNAVTRYLPGKRLAGFANWQNEEVFVKFFFGESAYCYAKRDCQGLQRLSAANILAPTVLWFCQVQANVVSEDVVYALILQKLSMLEDIELVMQSEATSEKLRLDLANALIMTVASHHHAGLLQQDLFLKNFLWSSEPSQTDYANTKNSPIHHKHIFTLDGDGIKTFGVLTKRRALQNLCMLFSKFDVIDVKTHLADWLSLYAQKRGWQSVPNEAAIWRTSLAMRQKVAAHYADKKVFRPCTDVPLHEVRNVGLRDKSNQFASQKTDATKSFTQYTLNKLNGFLQTHLKLRREYVTWASAITEQKLDKALASPIFKSGNTCTVGLIQMPMCDANAQHRAPLVIKRYNIKSGFHAVARSLRTTRAAISWANAHRLMQLGLKANLPVALLELRSFFGLFASKSYFLMAYIDAPDVGAYFAQTQDKKLRAITIRKLAMLFFRMYLMQISHGDLKSTNIKIVDNAPVLIDLDSLKQHQYGWFATRRHARDLRRFMRNWQDDDQLYQAFKEALIATYQDQLPLKLAKILT